MNLSSFLLFLMLYLSTGGMGPGINSMAGSPSPANPYGLQVKNNFSLYFTSITDPSCIVSSMSNGISSLDGCIWPWAGGSSSIPRSESTGPVFPTTARGAHVCSTASQATASPAFRSLPEIHRRTQCRLPHYQQMGPEP